MKQIAFPSSAPKQGFAFEHLILSYYKRCRELEIKEWSSYLHGASGKWYQCDGIIEDDRGRWLLEAKFYANRRVTVRDIEPRRREQAAQDLGCTGVRYVSLSGFGADMLSYHGNPSIELEFVKWDVIRGDVLDTFRGYASVLLDEFRLEKSRAYSSVTASEMHLGTISPTAIARSIPEFAVFPDPVEQWLRRLPRLALKLEQIVHGEFRYQDALESVILVPGRSSDLSLEEAWSIEDALSGYSARVYSATRATAQAMVDADGGYIQDVQKAIQALGWETGIAGIRSSLNNLVLLGLLRKERDINRVQYHLTPMGRAYVARGEPDDVFFGRLLLDWPPYVWMRRAIRERGIAVDATEVADYFRSQYHPYEPYAHCLFNQNKSDGLVKLYEIFG